MNIEKLITFQLEAARYFRKRQAKGEDMAFWANLYNAENCEKTAKALEELRLLRAVKAEFSQMEKPNP